MTLEKRNGALNSAASNVHFLKSDNLKDNTPALTSQALRISDDPVMQVAVQRICDYGSRYVLELLTTLAEDHMQAYAVEKEIKRFALMPHDALRLIGPRHIQRFQPLEVPK